MKYALLIYDVPDSYDGLSESELEAISGEYFAISDEAGVYGGAQLKPTDTATVVRVENGDALTTDGPFADTREFLGGFYLLEADSLDEALDVAKRIPAGRLGGAIEVRPIVEHDA